MILNILTKGPQLVDPAELARAAAVEASIVNHCVVNLHGGMDQARADRLMRVRDAAQDRYEVLMEMIR